MMKKKEYKEKVKGFKEGLKSVKKTYKAERPSLIDRIKAIIVKIKKLHKIIFRAWYLIVDLKDEIFKLKEEIEEWNKVEE